MTTIRIRTTKTGTHIVEVKNLRGVATVYFGRSIKAARGAATAAVRVLGLVGVTGRWNDNFDHWEGNNA